MRRGIIYKITNKSFEDEFFIGSTTQPLIKIWRLHKKCIDNSDLSLRLQAQGLNGWKVERIENDIEPDRLMERHLFWNNKLSPMLTGEIIDGDDYFINEGPLEEEEEDGWLSFLSLSV